MMVVGVVLVVLVLEGSKSSIQSPLFKCTYFTCWANRINVKISRDVDLSYVTFVKESSPINLPPLSSPFPISNESEYSFSSSYHPSLNVNITEESHFMANISIEDVSLTVYDSCAHIDDPSAFVFRIAGTPEYFRYALCSGKSEIVARLSSSLLHRAWSEVVYGFGSVFDNNNQEDFWIGLEKLHELFSTTPTKSMQFHFTPPIYLNSMQTLKAVYQKVYMGSAENSYQFQGQYQIESSAGDMIDRGSSFSKISRWWSADNRVPGRDKLIDDDPYVCGRNWNQFYWKIKKVYFCPEMALIMIVR